MVEIYDIVKKKSRYDITHQDSPREIVEVKYRFPGAVCESYPARGLTSQDVLLAVLGLYYNSNENMQFHSKFKDKTIMAVKSLSEVMNQKNDSLRQSELAIHISEGLLDGGLARDVTDEFWRVKRQ